jgi:hypothetical protein
MVMWVRVGFRGVLLVRVRFQDGLMWIAVCLTTFAAVWFVMRDHGLNPIAVPVTKDSQLSYLQIQ